LQEKFGAVFWPTLYITAQNNQIDQKFDSVIIDNVNWQLLSYLPRIFKDPFRFKNAIFCFGVAQARCNEIFISISRNVQSGGKTGILRNRLAACHVHYFKRFSVDPMSFTGSRRK